MGSVTGTLYITGDAEADGLLNRDGTALLVGMLLDQQVPMEWAFAGPATLRPLYPPPASWHPEGGRRRRPTRHRRNSARSTV